MKISSDFLIRMKIYTVFLTVLIQLHFFNKTESFDASVYGCRKSASPPEKILGQVQAIDRMIDEDVPCEDVLAQINAAKSALHGCGRVVLEGHIKHCVRDGIEHGDADRTIDSFTKAVERFANMT